jgi:hypothetical protein
MISIRKNLVHIQACASFVDNLHACPPFNEEYVGRDTRRQATGYRAWVKFSHTCFADASERQTLVLGGIQVILLVRLVALVSNRPLALDLPSLKYTRPFFMGAGARAAHELLLANDLRDKGGSAGRLSRLVSQKKRNTEPVFPHIILPYCHSQS